MTIKVHMVSDWAQSERALQDAPREVQRFKVQHKDKGTQGVFVGRDEEEAELLQLLQSNVKPSSVASPPSSAEVDQKAEQSGGKGVIIVAPPGAGKSTLLDHVLQKAQQEGIGVVHLSHECLATAEMLNQELQDQEPWKSWIGERGLPARLTDALAAGTDSIISTLLQSAGEVAGMQISHANVDVFTRMIDGWRQHETYSAKRLLQQIDRAYPDGFVVAIDEAQQLRRHLPAKRATGTSTVLNTTSTVLNTLGDPNTRRIAGIAHGTIILAGLSDTEHVVREFGTMRQQVIPLPPIQPKAVAELIKVRIRHSGCTPEECDAAVQAWEPPLATEFGTWTHHAQCAAYAAQQVLANFGRTALEANWGWPLVRRETLRGVEDLYLFVTTRAQDTAGTIHMETVAHALRRNGNYIAHDTMVGLLNRTEIQRAADTLDPRKDAADILVELLHAGLIEPVSDPRRARRVVAGRQHPGGFRIGIPSVGSYITEIPPDAAMLERIAACGLHTALETEPNGSAESDMI